MSEYSSSNQKSRDRTIWLTWVGLLCLTLVSISAYITTSVRNLRIGFPLDDAWIHQTYARNLAEQGEWAFIPGQPSGGSTSPLWTVLLAGGYLAGVSPFIWTFILGGILLFGLALQTERGVNSIQQRNQGRIPWAGIIILLEWHFIWSSVSGMETLLHAVIILAVALLLLRESPPWFVIGLLAGLSTWVRPDGITLIGPVLFTAFCVVKGWRDKGRGILLFLAGFCILFLPYLAFNYSLTGKLLPTTFYAKQAEYSAWQARSILGRSGDVVVTFLTGTAIILLPGLILQVIDATKKRKWGQISMFLWILGYLGIYMLRLPVYQHGRYLVPAMPIFFLLSLGGFLAFIKDAQKANKYFRLLKVFWGATLSLVCLGFWFLGMNSYKNDVEFVETEMVDTALWVDKNIPEDALVAAHDIGALGYFDHHKLVDLAGLITPEVITFLLDEGQLENYLDDEGVNYLVVFPDWYPTLIVDLVPVFTTGASYAPSVGETNMTVYLWTGQ